MHRENIGDSAASVASVQHALLFRRLQRSQIDNAVIRKKAQRFVALKTLRQTVELRQQLHQKHAAASLAGGAAEPIPTPLLDHSVKALIEKLTEIAELLPSRYYDDQQTHAGARPQPRQHAVHGRDNTNVQQVLNRSQRRALNDVTEANVSPASSIGHAGLVDGSQDMQSGARGVVADEDGWDEGDATDLNVAKHLQADDELESKEATIVGSSDAITPLNNKEYIDPLDETMSHKLLELDSNVNSLFQDLEKKSAQASKNESDMKTAGAREKAAVEAIAEKQRSEKARQRERAALMAQLEARTGGVNLRRPRWRWIAEGVENPEPDRVLQGKNLWRATAFLIIVFYVRPKRLLMQRKARSKDRDTQDWNATLTIYFDRCQTWLLKAARVPVGNSMLKSPKLSFRLNRLDVKREAYGTSTQGSGNTGGGFVSTLVKKVARGMSHENLALTLMRLKVHVKGVLQGLTQEMPPSDIMTFFSYLAADGNYFPEDFFFKAETKVLSFDDLGAVRKLAADTDPPETLDDTPYALHPSNVLQTELEASTKGHHEGFFEAHRLGWLAHAGPTPGKDGKTEKGDSMAATVRPTDLRAAVLHGRKNLPGKLRPVYHHEANGRWLDTSLVEMILTNYLMVRVLIPWILLYPRESGLVPSSGVKPSVLTHNCQVLASTVYLIVRVLRPELTPPNPDTIKAAAADEIARAAKIALGDDEGIEEDRNSSKPIGGVGSEAGSDDEANQGEKTSPRANQGTDAPDPKAAPGDTGGNRGGTQKKTATQRRRSRAARAPLKPRTVHQIMQQKRYVSVSDTQLVPGLLPDAYFLPVAEQMRPWVLQLAAEFDVWMQKVVVVVMGKVEGSVHRHDRATTDPTDEQGS